MCPDALLAKAMISTSARGGGGGGGGCDFIKLLEYVELLILTIATTMVLGVRKRQTSQHFSINYFPIYAFT